MAHTGPPPSSQEAVHDPLSLQYAPFPPPSAYQHGGHSFNAYAAAPANPPHHVPQGQFQALSPPPQHLGALAPALAGMSLDGMAPAPLRVQRKPIAGLASPSQCHTMPHPSPGYWAPPTPSPSPYTSADPGGQYPAFQHWYATEPHFAQGQPTPPAIYEMEAPLPDPKPPTASPLSTSSPSSTKPAQSGQGFIAELEGSGPQAPDPDRAATAAQRSESGPTTEQPSVSSQPCSGAKLEDRLPDGLLPQAPAPAVPDSEGLIVVEKPGPPDHEGLIPFETSAGQLGGTKAEDPGPLCAGQPPFHALAPAPGALDIQQCSVNGGTHQPLCHQEPSHPQPDNHARPAFATGVACQSPGIVASPTPPPAVGIQPSTPYPQPSDPPFPQGSQAHHWAAYPIPSPAGLPPSNAPPHLPTVVNDGPPSAAQPASAPPRPHLASAPPPVTSTPPPAVAITPLPVPGGPSASTWPAPGPHSAGFPVSPSHTPYPFDHGAQMPGPPRPPAPPSQEPAVLPATPSTQATAAATYVPAAFPAKPNTFPSQGMASGPPHAPSFTPSQPSAIPSMPSIGTSPPFPYPATGGPQGALPAAPYPQAARPGGRHAGASTSLGGFASSVFSKDTVKWSKKTASRLGGAIKTAASTAHAAATSAQAAATQAAALQRQRSVLAAQAKASASTPGPVHNGQFQAGTSSQAPS